METGNFGEDSPEKNFATLNRNDGVGTITQRLLHPDGPPATTAREMSDLIRKTFQGFYRADWNPLPLSIHVQKVHMATPLITESETQQDLNPTKGAGPDGLFPKALKTLSLYIAPTLSEF